MIHKPFCGIFKVSRKCDCGADTGGSVEAIANSFTIYSNINEHTKLSTVCSNAPSEYRLARTPDGIILQGYFTWISDTCGGGEWKDIPTVELEE